MGDRTAALERAWATYCDAPHAIFMANGTLALEAVLVALGIGPGDEVVTVSLSFNATVSAILRVGATPVFVDVRDDDFCMDPELVESAITDRTRLIMPVHLYGLMADMAPIKQIADRHGLRNRRGGCPGHRGALPGTQSGVIRAGSFQPLCNQERGRR